MGMELAHRRALLPCCVLLLLGEAPRHGYELAQALVEFGFGTNPTYVYRTLRKLEENGMLRSEWELTGRHTPARRTYSLTADGECALDCSAAIATELDTTLRHYRTRYDALRRRPSSS